MLLTNSALNESIISKSAIVLNASLTITGLADNIFAITSFDNSGSDNLLKSSVVIPALSKTFFIFEMQLPTSTNKSEIVLPSKDSITSIKLTNTCWLSESISLWIWTYSVAIGITISNTSSFAISAKNLLIVSSSNVSIIDISNGWSSPIFS